MFPEMLMLLSKLRFTICAPNRVWLPTLNNLIKGGKLKAKAEANKRLIECGSVVTLGSRTERLNAPLSLS